MSATLTSIVIEEANRTQQPLLLIPSRRQVDSEATGGGYVENWSTKEFSTFVRDRDEGNFVILARDHSGPWQGNVPTGATFESEWTRMEQSVIDDIKCGFDVIHCDPSPALQHGASQDDIDNMAVDMASFVTDVSKDFGTQVAFEIGTDEQKFQPDQIDHIIRNAEALLLRLKDKGVAPPLFYVAQTGTKVVGTENTGVIAKGLVPKRQIHPYLLLRTTAERLHNLGMGLKVHNGDYLTTSLLEWHHRLGLHAMNVAPEFGVIETDTLLTEVSRYGLKAILEEWEDEIWQAGAWKRWTLDPKTASRQTAVRLAGHYHFASPLGQEVRYEVSKACAADGRQFNSILEFQLRKGVRRFLRAFGYQN